MIFRFWVLAMFVLSTVYSCVANCSVPTSARQRIETLRKTQSPQLADFELGMVQVDIPSCLEAATDTFRNLSNTANNQQKHLANGMLAVVNARRLVQSGDRQAAIQAYINTASNYQEFPAYLRAVHDLALLLQTQPNAQEWQFLSTQLERVASIEDVAGMAADSISQIALHDIRTQHSEAGLARMEKYLARAHPVQIRLLSSILYLELLREAEYIANAQILCHDLDNDVGNMELDPTMRVRFLQVCSSVYMSSHDPQGQLRYQRFSDALARARSELP